MSPITRYRIVAVLALVGLFVSVYLLLYSLGYYGIILCGAGSCEVVQASRYAELAGVPVAGWGVAWYAGMLVLALILASGVPEGNWQGRVLGLGATAGLAFTIYLTAIEAFVLEAWCRWCVVSAILTTAIFLLVAPWRMLGRGGHGSPTPERSGDPPAGGRSGSRP